MTRHTFSGYILAATIGAAAGGGLWLLGGQPPAPTIGAQQAGSASADTCLAAAIGDLTPGDPAHWTRDGLPRVEALEALTGEDITATMRDLAWRGYQAAPAQALTVCLTDAIADLTPGDPAHWTRDGLPRVRALEALTGNDITAAERDLAWEAYRQQ